MPQLRSFSGFAPTPDLGGIYNNALKNENDLQAQREAIQQRAVQASLEHQAQMAALENRSTMQAQELAFNKAYQDQVLGLKSRELDAGIQEAADKYAFDQAQQNQVAKMFSQGAADVPNAKGWKAVPTSAGHVQLIPPPDEASGATTVPGFGGSLVQSGKRILINPEYARLTKQIDTAQKLIDGRDFEKERDAFSRFNAGESLGSAAQMRLERYQKAQSDLVGLKRKLNLLVPPAAAPDNQASPSPALQSAPAVQASLPPGAFMQFGNDKTLLSDVTPVASGTIQIGNTFGSAPESQPSKPKKFGIKSIRQLP